MNKKDSLAILGLLFTGPFYTFYGLQDISELDKDILEEILAYIESLDLDYDFVKDILTDDYDSDFYHVDMGCRYRPLPENYDKNQLYRSEHDGQIWLNDGDKVRIGVWCEVDGFIAWLDEYQKTWIVDSREEVAARKEKQADVIKEIREKALWFPWSGE